MSTLSFQDYVRERMLRRRHEALNGPADTPTLTDRSRDPTSDRERMPAPAGGPPQPAAPHSHGADARPQSQRPRNAAPRLRLPPRIRRRASKA